MNRLTRRAALTEIETVKTFIHRCDLQIAMYQADAAAQTRPELASVYAEIADIWIVQKLDLERRLADMEKRNAHDPA
jgi:hypothetical protein